MVNIEKITKEFSEECPGVAATPKALYNFCHGKWQKKREFYKNIFAQPLGKDYDDWCRSRERDRQYEDAANGILNADKARRLGLLKEFLGTEELSCSGFGRNMQKQIRAALVPGWEDGDHVAFRSDEEFLVLLGAYQQDDENSTAEEAAKRAKFACFNDRVFGEFFPETARFDRVGKRGTILWYVDRPDEWGTFVPYATLKRACRAVGIPIPKLPAEARRELRRQARAK